MQDQGQTWRATEDGQGWHNSVWRQDGVILDLCTVLDYTELPLSNRMSG